MQVNEEVSVINRIISTIEIASKCGQAISIDEIALMLPCARAPANIGTIIQTEPNISKLVSIEGRFVVFKGHEHLFSKRISMERVAKKYQEIAGVFACELLKRSQYVEMMAICGSVAYGSAKNSDDIDFFIVTKENRMWFTFLKALLLARALKTKTVVNHGKADFCLSYIQDKDNFEKELMSQKKALFAREFLSLRVLTGDNYYVSLLERTQWVHDLFPVLTIAIQNKQTHNKKVQNANWQQSKILDALNLSFFATLGSFLRLKAFLRNLKYRKQHKMKDIFEASITKGSCVYTSERYQELEKKYDSSDAFRR